GQRIAGFSLLGDDQRRQFLALLQASSQTAWAAGFQGFLGALEHSRGRTIGFQMPRLAARAKPGVVAVVDDDMAAFGPGAVLAVDRQIADDDAAADPG